MTDEARLRELLARVTPLPWQVIEQPLVYRDAGDMRPGGVRFADRRIGTVSNHPQLHGPAPVVTIATTIVADPRHFVHIEPDDAAYLVAAANAVPALLAERDALARRVAALEAALRLTRPALLSWDDYARGTLWCCVCDRPWPGTCPHGAACPVALADALAGDGGE